jgi:hypothetical protein
MKTWSESLPVVVPAVLLVLFVAGSVAGLALALPFPPSLAGLGLVLVGLRVGVMALAIEESPEVTSPASASRVDAREPAMHAANG